MATTAACVPTPNAGLLVEVFAALGRSAEAGDLDVLQRQLVIVSDLLALCRGGWVEKNHIVIVQHVQ